MKAYLETIEACDEDAAVATVKVVLTKEDLEYIKKKSPHAKDKESRYKEAIYLGANKVVRHLTGVDYE